MYLQDTGKHSTRHSLLVALFYCVSLCSGNSFINTPFWFSCNVLSAIVCQQRMCFCHFLYLLRSMPVPPLTFTLFQPTESEKKQLVKITSSHPVLQDLISSSTIWEILRARTASRSETCRTQCRIVQRHLNAHLCLGQMYLDPDIHSQMRWSDLQAFQWWQDILDGIH